MTKPTLWIWILCTLGCAAESGAGFCVVDTDCPGQLLCTESVCESRAGSEAATLADTDALAGGAGASASAGRVDQGEQAEEADGANPPSTREVDDIQNSEPFANPPGQSRCQRTESTASCTRNEDSFMNRLVVWQVPLGEPPTDGWPAVVVYQGALYGPDVTWEGDDSMPFGAINQVLLQAELLDNGFAVVAPAADGTAWATNFPAYEASSDATFIPALLDAMEEGLFGRLDSERFYATGMSSGGYMTSRMAVTYPGRFTALAINSGSYATCSNVLCSIPELPADHPPTLFLHGELDIAVPVATMHMYEEALSDMGVETRVVVDPDIIHQWLAVAPEEITGWFLSH